MTANDLRVWRHVERLTQATAAELLGYSLRQYVTIEGGVGELPPRIERAFRGARAVLAERAADSEVI